MTLYNFKTIDNDNKQYDSQGQYYIDITPNKLRTEIDRYLTNDNDDWDFHSFINYLKTKYEVKQYLQPHFIDIEY